MSLNKTFNNHKLFWLYILLCSFGFVTFFMFSEGESPFDALGTIKKFNPVALILIIALMWITVTVFNLDIPLQSKIVPLAFSGSLYVIGTFFEFYRIGKKQELEQKERIFLQ